MRVEYDVTSEAEVGKLMRVRYRVVLLDTCFIYDYLDRLSSMASLEAIKRTGNLPSVCDFIDAELKYLDGKRRRALIAVERNPHTCIAFLRTWFRTEEDTKTALDMLPKPVRREAAKAYSDEAGESKFEDLALLTTAYVLASTGVKSGIATMDAKRASAARRVGEVGGLDLEVYRRPWTSEEPFRGRGPRLIPEKGFKPP